MEVVDTQSTAEALPKLAFVYHPRSFGTMAIVDAARGLCDVVWLVDTGDPRLGSMTRLLERVGTVVDVAGMTPDAAARVVSAHGVDGVLALSDELLEWTASLAHGLGLPFLSSEAARRLTDKYAQRSAFRAAGLAAPKSWVVNAATPDAAWVRLASDASFPVVLKPRHGAGSRNTLVTASMNEARTVVANSALEAGGVDGDWVIEEYIADIDHAVCGEGFANYLSVESFVVDGHPIHLAVTGRTPQAEPLRETGVFMPAAVDAVLASELSDTAGRAILALDASVGCFHTEIKLTPSGPVVIEVNGRIGGGIPELLELSAGIDFLGVALQLALGQKVGFDPLNFRGVAYQLLIQPPEDMHRITSIQGLEEVKALPGVREIALNRGPGQRVDWRDGNLGYVFTVLGVTDDHDGVRGIIDRVSQFVRIDGD